MTKTTQTQGAHSRPFTESEKATRSAQTTRVSQQTPTRRSVAASSRVTTAKKSQEVAASTETRAARTRAAASTRDTSAKASTSATSAASTKAAAAKDTLAGAASRFGSTVAAIASDLKDRFVAWRAKRAEARAEAATPKAYQPASSGILAGGVFQKASGAIARTTESYRIAKGEGKHTNVITIIVAVLVVLLIIFLLDFFLHVGRIHGNVYVGDVNLGGMSKSEAILELDSYYTKFLSEGAVTAYVSPNVKSQKQADDLYYMLTVNDTYLENHPEILARVISISELEGAVASTDLVDEAYSYGRGFFAVFTRLGLLFKPHVITPYANYGSVAIDSVVNSFNEAVGVPMRNCYVYVDNGAAHMEEGNDGYTVSHQQLIDALNKAFFSDTAAERQFVLYSSYTPMELNVEMATAAVETLNNAIGDGVICVYENHGWQASPITAGSWVRVGSTQKEDGSWQFTYSLDESSVYSWLLKWILTDEEDSIPVRMEKTKDKVTVYPDVSGRIPALSDAFAALQAAMFGDGKNPAAEGAQAIDGVPVEISVSSMSVSSSMSIDEAIAKGVVSPISSFSTCYINGSTTDNRTYNVRLAASMVDGVVVKAGEEFSFNSYVGATTEENGYKVGTVIDHSGEYVDGYGGGVCQVSTTMFNAVYYAGFPITERLNHMLYSANYPDGLDATVDYPSVDFKWVNNTESDIYIKFTDDGSSITCTLYGADPHYTVWSYTNPWQITGGYPTKYIIDTSKPWGYYEVTSVGVPSRRITVWRKVLDPTATEVLIDETFTSGYRAITEYVLIGPGDFADQMLAEGKASYK